MADDGASSIIGIVVLFAIGYGLYAFFTKPSDADQKKQQQQIQQQSQEIEQLKAKITALEQKPVEHHYELRTLGYRTWRFDPATGDSCIQFSTDADWKKKETIRQGCEYQDIIYDPNDTQSYWRAECVELNDKAACDRLANTTK